MIFNFKMLLVVSPQTLGAKGPFENVRLNMFILWLKN